MYQIKLQHIQDCIGRAEAAEIFELILKEGPSLLLCLNENFRANKHQEIQLQLSKSIGSIHLYGSPELVNLCRCIANENPLLECSENELGSFQETLNMEFKKSFSAIERFLS